MANIKVCPKTEQDIKTASNKLKCKYDRYNNSQYMCLPNKEKTSLVEFCHNGEMGIVEEGNCLEASLGTVSLHNCSRFERGCPNTTFFKYEMHKHSVCQEINTDQNCYVADPFCLPQKEDDVFNTYVVVIIVLAIIGFGFGLICYFWREIISAIYRCARKHMVKPGTEQEEEIPLVDEHLTHPKLLARIEHNKSVNQGRTENKAVPPANPIKDQASNFQSQSEYSEREIKKDGSPGQKGLCISIKDDAKIDAIHYDNCDFVNMDLNMQGKSTIGKIIIKKDKGIDREKSGSSSDRTEDPESPGRSSDRTDDRENSGPSSDRTEGIDRENSGPSSDRTEDPESPGRSSDRTDDQENSGSSSDRTEDLESSSRSFHRTDDRENSGPIYDRLEDLQISGRSSDRTEDQENSGPSYDRTEDQENSAPTYDRLEDQEKSGPSYDRTEDRENFGPTYDGTEDPESPGCSSDRTDDRENLGPTYDGTEDLGTEFDYFGLKKESNDKTKEKEIKEKSAEKEPNDKSEDFGFKPEPNNKSEDEQQLKDPSLAGKEVSDKELD